MTGDKGVPTSLIVAELIELICYPTPSSDSQVALLISSTGVTEVQGLYLASSDTLDCSLTSFTWKKKQYGKMRSTVNINQG